TKEEILTIVDIQMKRVREQMATHDVVIELTDEAKELLVEKGYDPAMGARPLRRAIQRVIEDPLADFVLGRSREPGPTILVARTMGLTDAAKDREAHGRVERRVFEGQLLGGRPDERHLPPELGSASSRASRHRFGGLDADELDGGGIVREAQPGPDADLHRAA